MSDILVLHGPNLNLLGERESDIYGTETLSEIDTRLLTKAKHANLSLTCRQSNSESELIEIIHTAKSSIIIINPAAFTHTSIALRDAISGVAIPFIEVHLSNIYTREPFRHYSYFSDIAIGVICGLGSSGYDYALMTAINHINAQHLPKPENQYKESEIKTHQ